MRTRDLMVVAVTALVTAAGIVGLYASMTHAVADVEKAAAPVPTLTLDGATLSLTLDKASYAAGEKPTVTLHATNMTDAPVAVKVDIRLMSRGPTSEMSRRPVMPTLGWSNVCAVELMPNETKAVEIPTGVAVSAGNSGSFTMTAGGKTIAAAAFSVAGAPAPLINGAKAPAAGVTKPVSEGAAQ